MSDKNQNEVVPWLPEESFWHENHEAINDIMTTLHYDHPAAGVPNIDHEKTEASKETERWMFDKLLGHQHGTMEGEGDKIMIPRAEEYKYWPDLSRVHYGDHYFTVPSKLKEDKEYTKAFILAGTQDENIDRLLAAQGYSPGNENVREFVVMAGQRLRGIWRAPGEGSLDDLLTVTAQYSGVDMDKLSQASPFIKDQKSKIGEGWQQPFATEYEMCRLAVEAVFQKQIDWPNYPVEFAYDQAANRRPYKSINGMEAIPPRFEALATYTLKDGRKVSIVNGKAILRAHGIPRPTSDSAARESVELVGMQPGEDILIASNIPHARAALDALVRIINLRGALIKNADIVTGKWVPWKTLIAGLGEIPGTNKADRRLRAVLGGHDPDNLSG